VAVPRPGKGVCGGVKFFGSALLRPARSFCVSLGAFFIRSGIGMQNFTYIKYDVDDTGWIIAFISYKKLS